VKENNHLEYAVVDIETTGGTPIASKITEIAIIITDGSTIKDSYESLINPEIPIPYNITRLTGIDNSMVAEAPRFFEIAKDILSYLEGRIFVAHNVNFDYGHIKREFKELGYNFEADKLCTVRMSRKVFPGLPSYSLGKLCKSLGVTLTSHHRAMADTAATTEIFHLIKEQDKQAEIIQDFSMKIGIDKLPGKPGVYYFKNQEGRIIYIGKSINIKKRVKSHLNNYQTKKGLAIIENIDSVDYEITGNETLALLYENLAIKTHLPKHNRRQTKTKFPFGIVVNKEGDYHSLETVNVTKERKTVIDFSSRREAMEFIKKTIDNYELCQKINGLENQNRVGSCFRYQLHDCHGACIGEESADDYNLRIEKFEQKYGAPNESGIFVAKGRKASEKGFVLLENGTLTGFGFVSAKAPLTIDSLKLMSEVFQPDKDYQQVIKTMFRNGNFEKVY
jgi:DNA polymerase-3 subunit epsilon